MRFTLALLVLCCFVQFSVAQDMPLSDVLIDGKSWERVAEGYKFTEGPAVDANGDVYFVDVPNQLVLKVDHATKQVRTFSQGQGATSGLMFGPDGRLYGGQNRNRRVVVFQKDGTADVIAEELGANDIVVASNGNIYCTDPKMHQVWLVRPNGTKEVVARDITTPNGIILWPGEGTLVIADSAGENLIAYRVEEDGRLTFRAPVYTCRVSEEGAASRADGMTVDSAGRLYVATEEGLQMFDSTARISGVMLKPADQFLSNVVFGGPNLDWLYVTCGDGIYRRPTQATGVRYGKLEAK
ncbi:SMP-30/gluconolactonase/LRE family protein [Bremerella sp. T1]|uniref:SMP-30/gluconolactonase/LRE family protein n=1 Tax=Bremerella sp. TYQ1 TaxID=3119568 RepID=UPI001CCEB52A|nr:SMP-30/gluconolactonase/LRE family protein [Bremerella volcania]UBM36151.1 SMP-30/gluconolactonase/LRE family protein [Bremerella volcania]